MKASLLQLAEYDLLNFIIIAFLILIILKEVIEIFSYFLNKLFGIQTRFMRRQSDSELVKKHSAELDELRRQRETDVAQSIKHDCEIKDEIHDLKAMFIDKEIDDMRWEILNFANVCMNSKIYNQEQFSHVMKQYTKYEKILAVNKMENGQVDISMEFINELYKENMKDGVFTV